MIQNQNGKETKLNLIIKQPDYQYIHKELLRPGTNIRLLWEEYAEDCRNNNFPFYQYSYFCEKYRDYVKKNNLTMHITHKPGDKLMVDWLCKDSHNQSYAKKIVMRSLSKIYPDNQ